MISLKHILFTLLMGVLLSACNPNSNSSCGSAWIGGEIVNPKKDFVVISRNRDVIDTIALDDNNFFTYKIEGLDPGLFVFRHNEYQTIFIEPGDSIMFRVNTVEFDESLSYTGVGAEKNNLLMDLYLKNQEEDKILPTWYALSPSDFNLKLDSISSEKKELYNNFALTRTLSNQFDNIAKATINYDYFFKKELYISANARQQVYNDNINIPASFYDFRREVDFGNEELRGHYTYYRYLSYCLDNMAFDQYKDSAPYNRNSFIHNSIKSTYIDSLITNDSLRNSLLRYSARRYFLNTKDEENGHKMLNQFQNLSTSKRDVKEIKGLAEATIKLTPGHIIPNLKLLTTQNTVTDLHSTFNKPTVIYFWTNKSIKHYRDIHVRASELKAKYPEYNFIGINVDTHFKQWLKTIHNSGYNQLSEYQFESIGTAEKKLVINSVNKAIIVDKNAEILNGNTNIFSHKIETELLGYLN